MPSAQLAGVELDIRLLVDHRERLIRSRVALNNDLLWHLHDLWPELKLPGSALFSKKWSTRIARRLARAEQTARVRIARDELRRLRELTVAANELEAEIADLVDQVAPQLLAEPGFGPLTAAKLLGEIAGAGRFATDAKLARAAGVAPIPVSSGKTNRHRLDRGGNRQLNTAIHRIALTRARCHPETQDYLARKRAEGKTGLEAMRCLKRHLTRRIWHLLQPPHPDRHEHRHHQQFLDIGAAKAAASGVRAGRSRPHGPDGAMGCPPQRLALASSSTSDPPGSRRARQWNRPFNRCTFPRAAGTRFSSWATHTRRCCPVRRPAGRSPCSRPLCPHKPGLRHISTMRRMRPSSSWTAS